MPRAGVKSSIKFFIIKHRRYCGLLLRYCLNFNPIKVPKKTIKTISHGSIADAIFTYAGTKNEKLKSDFCKNEKVIIATAASSVKNTIPSPTRIQYINFLARDSFTTAARRSSLPVRDIFPS